MLLQRIIRFGMCGGLTSALSYVVFVGLIDIGAHYSLACGGSWIAGTIAGFLLHRRFTFGIQGGEQPARAFGLYAGGQLLQLAIGLTGYAWLIGRLGIAPSPAFLINLAVTSSFSFMFMSLVTFRKARRALVIQE